MQRRKVIEMAKAGRMTVNEAATMLGISERQVYRLKEQCAPGEVGWVRHGNVGRQMPRRLSEQMRQQVLALAQDRYVKFNDTHLSEKLQEVEGISISRESVRRILRSAGLASPQKRRPPRYRSRRERKPCPGMMVLTDGSRDDWLEERGPKLTLIGYQDDATSKVLAAEFQLEHEDTIGYLRQLRVMVKRYGVPLSVYRDGHGTFQRNDRHWTLEEELAGKQTATQLGRVLEELGIESIHALSAAAKGRIERLWRTFQDRLKSELRLAQASTLEQANRVLQAFVPEYNRRFGKAARESGNAFRRLGPGVNWDRLFRLRYERVVGKDHVISFGAHPIQLPAIKGSRGYAGQRVELSHQLNGELHVWLGEQHLHKVQLPLEYSVGMAPPRPAARTRKRQPRMYTLGGRAAVAVRP